MDTDAPFQYTILDRADNGVVHTQLSIIVTSITPKLNRGLLPFSHSAASRHLTLSSNREFRTERTSTNQR